MSHGENANPDSFASSNEAARASTLPGVAPIPRAEREAATSLLRTMTLARALDRVEMELVQRGEAFFHVGGDGHEGTAALAAHLIADDYLHLHYRDKALMLARGLTPEDFLHGLVCTAESHSAGRQMSAHLSSRRHNLMSLVGPVGNNALQAVGVAHELVARRTPNGPRPLVVCAMGDGTTQQGEVLEAIAEAARSSLPMLFLVADNGLAISTDTRRRTFFESERGPEREFHGIPIIRVDGRDAWTCHHAFGRVTKEIRAEGAPRIVVVDVERLTHHTNGDDERVYRADDELRAIREAGDPIAVLRARLLASTVPVLSLDVLEVECERAVRASIDRVLATPNPVTAYDARTPWTGPETSTDAAEIPGERPTTMLDAMRAVLRDALASDPRVSLYGEDIEDPKGDVFGLTRGLSSAFPSRVKNSPLSESTIVGVSIGRALAGGRPIAFVQFADFLPLAFNQIASELASLAWRTNGTWTAPVVILAPCGGYRPGLGPFHAQSAEATYAHVPGLDVVMPASAEDAAGLLRAVLAGGRPTLFLYPKMMLNDASVATTRDVGSLVVRPGEARVCRRGDDVTLVSWGATVPLCDRAATLLEAAGVSVELLDLRSQSPWDVEAVLRSVRKTKKLVVVHEDNLSVGFGAEVVATASEHAGVPIAVRRVARPDTHVPCNYVSQLELLPSVRRVLDAVAPLVGVEVHEVVRGASSAGEFAVEAVGSSPADQNVTVVEWRVREGEGVHAGDPIAECEADKATFELCAPVSGVVRGLVAEGQVVKVGTVLATIAGAKAGTSVRRVPLEPVLELRASTSSAAPGKADSRSSEMRVGVDASQVGLASIAFTTGSVVVDNHAMVARFPDRTPEDIVQRTGIESRFHCGEGESALTLATSAAKRALADAGLALADLDAIFVTTSTPLAVTPSLACRLQLALADGGPTTDVQASDVFAACSGYLYALQAAHDFCRAKPNANVLVVTAEAMSRFVDPSDFDTAIVFGDAATASVVRGAAHLDGCRVRVSRPLLSARGEDGSILSLARVERAGAEVTPVAMNGVRVFPVAVREMAAMLGRACTDAGIAVTDLDYVVPHQANARILAAAEQRAKLPKGRLVSNVARYGNTSSSSIPIALAEMLAHGRKGRAGLAAFGGGFTFGAAIVDIG